MKTFLDRIKPGTWAVVTKIDVKNALSRRLYDFGFIPGTRVCCRYRGPNGRVTALQVRGTVIALRTQDLRCIEVEL